MPARQLQDLFIAAVSISLGACLLIAAWNDNEWFFRLRKAEFLTTRFGRAAARRFYAVLGLILVAMGVFTAWGG